MALSAQKTNREKRKFLSVFLLPKTQKKNEIRPRPFVLFVFRNIFILFSLLPMYDGAVPPLGACREIPADAMPHK